MHRKPLLDAIARYAVRFPATQFPGEADTVERITHFVDQHTDCFQRTLETGHITGSAWIINAENNLALFTHHRKLNMWLQLGGHADGESTVQNVAMREACEESGLTNLQLVDAEIFDIDIHLIPERIMSPAQQAAGKRDEKAHYHYDVRYLIQSTSDEALQISDESTDLAWFSIEKIRATFDDESIMRMARKWQAR